jgi:hypothetical protein
LFASSAFESTCTCGPRDDTTGNAVPHVRHVFCSSLLALVPHSLQNLPDVSIFVLRGEVNDTNSKFRIQKKKYKSQHENAIKEESTIKATD